MGAKRKSYTPKFRAEAERLVNDTGRPSWVSCLSLKGLLHEQVTRFGHAA